MRMSKWNRMDARKAIRKANFSGGYSKDYLSYQLFGRPYSALEESQRRTVDAKRCR
jgi:hypothetical protein